MLDAIKNVFGFGPIQAAEKAAFAAASNAASAAAEEAYQKVKKEWDLVPVGTIFRELSYNDGTRKWEKVPDSE